MNQHQNTAFPSVSSSVKPNALGNQYVTAAMQPKTTPPMTTLWKCATRNRLLCSTKSTGGTAIRTPVMPPIVNVSMKPIVQSTGDVKRTRPPYIVNSQLKIFTPVGIEITIVVMPKNE